MSEQDGGPAFPLDPHIDIDTGDSRWLGMSLRDYFAGQALQGLFTYNELYERGVLGVSKVAYELADAMLEARKR